MTEKELKDIIERCNSASNGQWLSFVEGRDHESGDSFIMTGISNKDDFESENRGEDIYLTGATIADQDFIANARQDIPKLIAEIRKSKQETYKNFLRDLIYLIKENINDMTDKNEFSDGKKFGYEQILDLIESQANAFGIELKDIGYNDFENFMKKNNVG